MGANKLENFEMMKVHRSCILNADYNPRKIKKEAKAKLKKFLKKDGLLSPLTWNKKTSNLVSGHQRLSIMDTILGTNDYFLTVAAVELDEKEEIAANIKFNNPSVQGEWDYEILANITDLGDFDFEADFGFSKEESELIWDEVEENFDSVEQEHLMFGGEVLPEVPTEEQKEEFREAKAAGREKAKQENADGLGTRHSKADYFVTIVFLDAERKAQFMEKLGKPPHEQRLTSESLFEYIEKGE